MIIKREKCWLIYRDQIKILRNIADAAGPKVCATHIPLILPLKPWLQSKLIIIETVSVPGISQGPNTLGPQIMGLDTLNDDAYQPVSPPPFIPANLGAASKHREGLVLHLLAVANAHGRTQVGLLLYPCPCVDVLK